MGIGDWGLGPIPNPQSPIPNPQSPSSIIIKFLFLFFFKILLSQFKKFDKFDSYDKCHFHLQSK